MKVVWCILFSLIAGQSISKELSSYQSDEIDLVNNDGESMVICDDEVKTDCVSQDLIDAMKYSFRLSTFNKMAASQKSNREKMNRMIDLATSNGSSGEKKPGHKGYLSLEWGYNRTIHWHSGDSYFNTPEGNFVIRDVKADDRPAHFKNLLDYVNPAKFTIPQYNVELKYLFYVKNKRIHMVGFGIGTDHMKWIFDNEQYYEVEGDFSADLYVWTDHDGARKISFDEVKESGDLSWLSYEHSDGYNYAFLNSMLYFNAFSTRDGKIKVLPRIGAGLGVLIPKTKVVMHRDAPGNYAAVDNRFHLAGYGAHFEVGLEVTFFDRFFIAGQIKNTFITVVDSLVNGDPAYRLKQPFIGSTQFTWFLGYRHPIGRNQRKQVQPRSVF